MRVVTPPGATRRGWAQQLLAASAQRTRAQQRGARWPAGRRQRPSHREGPSTPIYTGRFSAEDRRVHGSLSARSNWHRWLGVSAEGGRGAVGDRRDNRAFCWRSRTYSGGRVSGREPACAASWFRGSRTSRAHFNWHNTIGLWCAPVLVVLTLTGVVMSYPWANALPGSRGGCRSPAAGAPRRRARRGRRPPRWICAWARTGAQCRRGVDHGTPAGSRRRAGDVPIVDGRSWNAFARSQLTVDAATANITGEP